MQHFDPSAEQNEKGEIFCNIGTGEDITIRELATVIQDIVGYT